jgi:hypothetical protein
MTMVGIRRRIESCGVVILHHPQPDQAKVKERMTANTTTRC